MVSDTINSGVDALKVMAAYIDLNPVRAELVESAEGYRWSGWSAALAGDKEAIAGLWDLMQCSEVIRLTERIRAFSGGVAVVSEGFVEEVFNERRDLFGPKRRRGARRVVQGKGLLNEVLCALRDLRGN